MATRTLQPSEYDIQREVEALRDIRRRSTTPGALTIDPDLPNQSPPSSPTYRSPSGESSIDGHSSETAGSSDGTASSSRTAVDNPFSLFWVPASAHPEINHNAFRAFLKEHAKSPPPDEEDEAPQSASSLSPGTAGGLTRRKSMLSRQYNPEDHKDDSSENEEIVPLKRNRSLAAANRGPQLTINELQKLEQLAEQAAESGDSTKFTNMLRRSLSMKMSIPEGTEDVMPMVDEADAPILVPPSGQPLRRAARTKIRKAGLPGDGGGHRFGASRRKGPPLRAGTVALDTRTSSDRSSDDHGEYFDSSPRARRRQTLSDDGMPRPESFSEEALIFDAYARDEEEDITISISPPVEEEALEEPPKSKSPVQPAMLEALGPVIHQPQPSKPTAASSVDQPPSPLPSPTPSDMSTSTADHSPPSQTPQQPLSSSLPTTPSPPSKKEKDKKGLFGKWGSDKGSKKAVKEKEKEKDREARERAEKDSGFFGSIFGGSKKKQDDQPPPLLSPGASSQAAQSILGSKNKGLAAAGASGLSPGVNYYSRYPIHVERAIYRLSHIKLANPRRPLYEQVLISNLMFWYLGVINKAQAQNANQNGQPAGAAPGQGQPNTPDQAELEKAQREREQKERAERERQEKEQKEREEAMKKKESGKRGSLVKNTGGQGGRRAEIPVKGPSYEMQHRVMEQEYAGYNMQNQQGMQMSRSASAPAMNNQYQRGYSQQQQQQSSSGEFFYYSSDGMQSQQSEQGRLPPGAMAPDQPTRQHNMVVSGGSQGSSRGQQPLGSSRYHTSQENLALGANGGERSVGRSLSATAVPSQPPPQTNGRSRKGQSAHAALPAQARRPRSTEEKQDPNGAGEEDIPLAMWQQQRRR